MEGFAIVSGDGKMAVFQSTEGIGELGILESRSRVRGHEYWRLYDVGGLF